MRRLGTKAVSSCQEKVGNKGCIFLTEEVGELRQCMSERAEGVGSAGYLQAGGTPGGSATTGGEGWAVKKRWLCCSPADASAHYRCRDHWALGSVCISTHKGSRRTRASAQKHAGSSTHRGSCRTCAGMPLCRFKHSQSSLSRTRRRADGHNLFIQAHCGYAQASNTGIFHLECMPSVHKQGRTSKQHAHTQTHKNTHTCTHVQAHMHGRVCVHGCRQRAASPHVQTLAHPAHGYESVCTRPRQMCGTSSRRTQALARR